MIVNNLKEFKDKINESSPVLVCVSFYDRETNQIHTSAFTNKFPIADLGPCKNEVGKVIENIYATEVARLETPKQVQDNATKEALS